jgi:hypothetical protein
MVTSRAVSAYVYRLGLLTLGEFFSVSLWVCQVLAGGFSRHCGSASVWSVGEYLEEDRAYWQQYVCYRLWAIPWARLRSSGSPPDSCGTISVENKVLCGMKCCTGSGSG